MPDHATPIKVQTHVPDPVPFMLWGPGFTANGAKRFTEAEAKSTGFSIDPGYNIMGRLIRETGKLNGTNCSEVWWFIGGGCRED